MLSQRADRKGGRKREREREEGSCRQLQDRICQTRFLLVPHPRSLFLDKCTECRDMKAAGVVLLPVDFSSGTRRKCTAAPVGAGRTAGGVQLNFRLRNLLRYKEIFLQGVRLSIVGHGGSKLHTRRYYVSFIRQTCVSFRSSREHD